MSTLIDAMYLLDRCQKELSIYEGAVADNKSRTVIHDDEVIMVIYKASGKMEYTEYEPELYRILCTPSICTYSYDYKKRRIMVEIFLKQKSGKRWGGMLGHFINLFRHREEALSDFLHNMPKRTGFTTDHANDDTGNHCSWNLSRMTARENLLKGRYLSRIKPPYYCYIAVDAENQYRVHFGYGNGWHWGQSFYILCETPETLNHFLRTAASLKEAPSFLRRWESIFSLWKTDKGAIYAAKNYCQAKKEAEQMLKMRLSDFDRWTLESKLECCRAERQYGDES